MHEDHFQRLLRCLELEAEAEARELARQARSGTGDVAERGGRSLVGLAIREEESGFGGRVVLTLGKRDRRLELPWTRLNSGTPVVLSEEQVSESGVWRGVVTERDRETITVVLVQSPEPIGDRPTFRLDLSSDEIARDRQRTALKRAAAADSGRLAVLKRKLFGEESPTFATKITRSVSEGERSADEIRESGARSPSLTLRVTESGWQPLDKLDSSQREAVSHALAAEDFAIIHGPPGTGKTTTVVALIRQAVRRGDKVLVCAPSNLAVDNLLERLLTAGEKVIRIGHPARVLPELREHTLDVQVASHPDLKLAREWKKQAWALRRSASKYKRTAPEPGARRKQRDEAKRLLADARQMEERLVEHLLDSADIVCATLTGLDDELLGNRQFDLAVIDEAAQTTEPPCWIPLLRANRLVLAGDHCQLPPTIVSPEASKLGFGVSLMERLLGSTLRSSVAPATEISAVGPNVKAVRRRDSSDARNASRGSDSPTYIATQLTTQYRMHEQIMRFSSAEFYDSTLVAADLVREHLLADLPHVTTRPLTQTPLRFFDTAGSSCEERAEADGSSRDNPGEAEFVARQVAELLATGLAATEIAVITPYAAQARLLRQLIAEPAVEIDTVDGFQGREKEAVVISLVRSNTTGELGFLTDTRRLNVALTRARRKLIVFGDSSTLANHEFFLRLLNFYEHEDVYGTIWELS